METAKEFFVLCEKGCLKKRICLVFSWDSTGFMCMNTVGPIVYMWRMCKANSVWIKKQKSEEVFPFYFFKKQRFFEDIEIFISYYKMFIDSFSFYNRLIHLKAFSDL